MYGRFILNFLDIFSLVWFRNKGLPEEEVYRASLWFVGHGLCDRNIAAKGNTKPDMKIVTRVMGLEVGYLTTPIILIQCALILLNQVFI